MDIRHPHAEVRADVELVQQLLASQHSAFAGREVTLVDEGWDNFTFRVAQEHAVRIPRRHAAVQLLRNEQKWLPVVAPWLAFEVPTPIGVGEPSPLFPWPWSVVPWIPGDTAEGRWLSAPDAVVLAASLRSLHRPAPPDAPQNPFRGVALRARQKVVEERLARLGLGELMPPWRRALEAPPSRESTWLHGDLHPRNVLVREGALAGVIDWGDLAAGDAATDLACAWMLFDVEGRSAFWSAYDASETEQARASGWAVNFASAMLDSGEARHVTIGRAIAREVAGS